MTYNFDPDRWYETRLAALEARLERGEIRQADYEKERSELHRRYEEILDRLDGTYQIPQRREEKKPPES
jgi:hypothetical protein